MLYYFQFCCQLKYTPVFYKNIENHFSLRKSYTYPSKSYIFMCIMVTNYLGIKYGEKITWYNYSVYRNRDMAVRDKFKSAFTFVKQVFTEYLADNVIKYSASLAYYTTLSIAPLIIIMISVVGFFFGKEAMQGKIYSEINGLVGSDAAIQIEQMIQNIHLSSGSKVATIISIIVLIVGATGIFGEMQDSLNKIWGLKIKSTRAWWRIVVDRLISFSLIISLGFVLLVSLMLSAVATVLISKLKELLGSSGESFVLISDNVLSILLSTMIFAIIFKILPDAKIKWKDVLVGALITACLFLFGKILISKYLGASNFSSVYGAAGSVIIIMIWVYYSSAILYLGAVFTKVFAINFGSNIFPNKYSTWIKIKEIPTSDITLTEKTNAI